MSIFDEEFLSYVPKHAIKDMFNQIYFLADIDKLVRNLRENGIEEEKLCGIVASENLYARNNRETPTDRALLRMVKCLNEIDFFRYLMIKARVFVL